MTSGNEADAVIATVEAIVLNDTDLGPNPQRLSQECGPANFFMQFYWLMLFSKNGEPPVLYVRTFGDWHENSRALIRFNEAIDAPQEDHPLRPRLAGQGEFEIHTIAGDPDNNSPDQSTYEYTIADPAYLYRTSSKSLHVREGDVLDLRMNYLPYALKATDKSVMTVPYVMTFGEVEGTLNGSAVRGLGGNEILYLAPDSAAEYQQLIVLLYCGVRKDRLRECAYVILGRTKQFAFFWRDGEKPVISETVSYRGEWNPLPYVDDDTVSPVNLDFAFEGRTLHYRGKWGFRGWSDVTKEPPGFSNTAGVVFEGETPYEHDMCFATAEAHNVLADTIRSNDF